MGPAPVSVPISVPVTSPAAVRSCTEPPIIEIGQSRSGSVTSSASSCFLKSEPVEGWQLNLRAPAILQIDLKSSDYFAHLVLADAHAQLTPLAESFSGGGRATLRSQLLAGRYIIWVGADGDDAGYELSVTAVPSGIAVIPGAALKNHLNDNGAVGRSAL
jgi:hypothetical protein